MSVILTSFYESDDILIKYPNTLSYSVSRWQPKGFFYPDLSFLGAYDKFGNRLRLKGQERPLSTYKDNWLSYLDSNRKQVDEWIYSLDNDIDIALCCWCPHSQSTKRQMKVYGTFACHTGIIGQVLNKFRPDIQILMDKDRDEKLVNKWKPTNYKVIK